jgi:hypothetical protein
MLWELKKSHQTFKLPEGSFLRSNGLWLGIGIIGLVGLWGIVIHENRKNSMQEK